MKQIHKIAAIVIQNNELLMVRKKGKQTWTSLGGKPENNETEQQALLREIKEEMNCGAQIIKKLGDFTAEAIFHKDSVVKLSTYLVYLKGNPKINDPELEEYRFIPQNYKQLGIRIPRDSMENQIIPFLIKEKLLDW